MKRRGERSMRPCSESLFLIPIISAQSEPQRAGKELEILPIVHLKFSERRKLARTHLILLPKIRGARPTYTARSRSRCVTGEEVALGQLMKVDAPLRPVKN